MDRPEPTAEHLAKAFNQLRLHGILVADVASLTGETVAKIEANWEKRGWVRLGPDRLELAPVLRYVKGAVRSAGKDMNELQRQRMRKARVEADEAEGRVLSREGVESDMLQLVHTLKRALRAIPGTLGAKCPETTARQMEVARDAIDEALTEAHARLTESPERPPIQPAQNDDLDML